MAIAKYACSQYGFNIITRWRQHAWFKRGVGEDMISAEVSKL